MSGHWDDTQVLITGASSGIGLATAERFIAAGADVVNVSRRPCPQPQVTSIALDFLSTDWRQQLPGALADYWQDGKRSVVVHNAAQLINDTIATADPGDLRRLLELNVVVPMALSQQLLPSLGPRSALIFVGSTLSEKAVPNALSYATSKHALIGLMRATTQDLAGRNVHAVAVCPGFTDTDMVRTHIPDPEVRTAIGANNGFGRLIEPDEIAQTIEFCAGNAVVNGAVIHANLGQLES